MGIERRYRRKQERETEKLRQKIHDGEVKKMKENPEKYIKEVEQYLLNIKKQYELEQQEEQPITKLRGA